MSEGTRPPSLGIPCVPLVASLLCTSAIQIAQPSSKRGQSLTTFHSSAVYLVVLVPGGYFFREQLRIFPVLHAHPRYVKVPAGYDSGTYSVVAFLWGALIGTMDTQWTTVA